MNKIYRLVWNRSTQTFVVASEFAKGKGKEGQSGKGLGGRWDLSLLAAAILGLGSAEAAANTVTAGSCAGQGGGATPGRIFYPNTKNGPSDGTTVDGTFAIIGGCEAQSNRFLGATVYGAYSLANGQGATALGFGSQASKWAVANGVDSRGNGVGAVAVGFGSNASGLNAVSIGSAAGDGNTPLSVANSTWSAGSGSIAIGANATRGAWSLANDAIALGGQATAESAEAVAVGVRSSSSGSSAVAVGADASASAQRASAFGRQAKATATDAVGIGSSANAASASAVAIGLNSRATESINAVVLGNNASADKANNGVALGVSSTAGKERAVAVGANSVASEVGAIAVGNASQGTAAGATALGIRAKATEAGAVALGQDSQTAAAVATTSGAVAGKTYQFAGTKPGSTVSVGAVGSERTVTNVAAGRLGGTSTDAVNGSQLFATNQAVEEINTTLNDLSTGGVGLVQQDATSRDITVAKRNDGKRVDFKGTAGDRVLAGVAKGAVNETSTEGVNGSQLYGTNKSVADSLGGGAKVNPDGSINRPTYNIGGKTINNVGDALTEVDGRVTNVDRRVTNLGDQINNGTLGLVKQDATSRDITVAKANDGKRVDFKGTAGERVLAGVAKGAVNETSTEAVNGSQLYGTNKSVADSLGGGAKVNPDGSITGPTYNINNKTINNVGDALTEVDGRVTNVDDRVTNLGDQINNGTLGLVKQDATSRDITVAKANDGKRVDFKGTAGERVLAGVAKGAVNETSTEGVNGSQLYGTNKSVADSLGGGAKVNPDGSITGPTYNINNKTINNVGDALTEVDGRVTNVDDRVTNLGDQINGGKGIKYFRANSTLADASATGQDSIAAGPRANAQSQNSVALGNGAAATHAGAVALGSGSRTSVAVGTASATLAGKTYQFAGSKPASTVSVGDVGAERTITNVAAGRLAATSTDAVNGSQLFSTNQAVNEINNTLDSINTNGVGLVQQDPTSRDITVAKRNDGKRVDFTGTEGGRVLAGVAKGAVNETSTEGVNGSQLYGTNKAVADSLGGGAKVNPDGSITGPTYKINNKTINNVGDALTEVDGRVTNVDDRVTNLGDQINNGTLGLVKQDATTRDITVAKANDGKRVDFRGTAGDRVLAGVAKGAINETSTEAVNGSQLYGTNKSVADSLGGGAKVNPDGSITGPTYNINNKTINNVGDAITEVDGRVTNLGDQINGGKGIKYFRANSTLADASATGQDSIAAGPRANAQSQNSVALGNGANAGHSGAVALGAGSQTSVAVGTASATLAGKTYQFAGSKPASTVSVGDVGAERTITNVAAGRLAATSTDAVNGSQLFSTNQAVNEINNTLDSINTNGVGLVQQDPTSRDITVAKRNDGKRVDFTGTEGGRVLAGVAKGAVNETSTEGVNGSQLYGTNKSVADSLGGGAKVNPDGSITGPTYNINNKTINNVGDAITEVDGRVTNLGDQINGGKGIKYFRANSTLADAVATGQDSIAIGPQASASAAGAVALGQGAVANRANTLSVGSATQQRQIVNVAKGSQDTDAVNVSQLKGAVDSLGGGAKVNPDGSVNGPTYNIGGKTINNVGDALTEVDGRVTNVDDRVTNLGDQINGGKGIKYFRANSTLADASATGQDSIAAGPRANAQSQNSVALGNGANAGHFGAVALGAGSRTSVAVGTASATLAGKTYQFAGSKPASTVSVGDVGAERTITNVAAGRLAATSTDAVNGSQLFSTNQAVNEINNTLDSINTNGVGLVQQDPTSRDITVAKRNDGKRVDFTGTEGGRVLAGVAKGAVNETSTEGVNGSQLYGTNKSVADSLGGGAKVNPDGSITGPTYKVNNKTINNVGDALTEVDGRVTNVDDRVTNLGDQINNGTLGLVKQDATSRDITVAKANDGKRVDFKGTAGERVLAGVAKGAVNETSTEAVNGSQLYGTNKSVADSLGGGAKVNPDGSITGPTYKINNKTINNVGDAITEVDGRVTNVDDRVTNLGDQISNGGIGLVQQDASSRDITVAKGKDGQRVDFSGTQGARKLAGVAKGEVSDTSTEAVNGAQLKTVDDRVTNVDGRVTNLGDQINGGKGIKYFRANSTLADAVASGMNAVAIGPQAMASAVGAVALGQGSVADRANAVSVGSAVQQRQIINLARGTQDTDAVNVSQLKGAVEGLGGGAKVNPDGSVTGPTYKINNKTVNNVGDAITNLGDMINNSSSGPGLVQQDSTSRDITVAKASDGKRVDFRGTEGDRVLAGVDRGAADNEGVNVSQLKGALDGLGGGAKVNPDGSITGPTYNIGGKVVNNAGDAITDIDARVTSISNGGVKYFRANSTGEAAMASGQDAVAAGPRASASGAASVAVGNGAQSTGANSVALGAGSVAERDNTVAVGSAGNERAITHVAAGKDATDAVNVSQLRDAQAGSLQYDRPNPSSGPDYSSITLGGPNGGGGGTQVRNLRDGAAPTDAVNVRQLQSGMQKTLKDANSYTDGRISEIQHDTWVARREARSGTAAAMAMAGMPQAYLPGKSMLAAAVGGYQGEGALAVGLSGITDNGRYVYKAQLSGNTSGDMGFSVGAGIQW